MASPITANSTSWLASAPIVAPTSSTMLSPLQRGPHGGDGGARDARQRLEHEARHGHQRAGIAGGDGGIGLARAHGVDRHPHAALAAALPQRLAGLGVHGHEHVRVDDLGAFLELGVPLHERRDAAPVAHQQETQLRMARRGKGSPGNHHLGARVTTHRIKRDGQMSFLVQSLAACHTW